MADYTSLLVTGPLLGALQNSVPEIDLLIQPWQDAEAAKAALVHGTTDIAISVFRRRQGHAIRSGSVV